MTVLPFTNTISLVSLKGQTLIDAFEFSANKVSAGAFLQVSGEKSRGRFLFCFFISAENFICYFGEKDVIFYLINSQTKQEPMLRTLHLQQQHYVALLCMGSGVLSKWKKILLFPKRTTYFFVAIYM
jgi:hypothetical protein